MLSARSLSLTRGFCSLLEQRNFIAAAPLVRLALDNCLRFYAAYLVSDPHKFAFAVMGGTPVNKLSSRDGKRLTDRYLVQKLSEEIRWLKVKDLYEHSSGYVHLSDKHLFHAVRMKPGTGRTIEIKINDKDEFISERLYIEATETFTSLLRILFSLLTKWEATKAKVDASELPAKNEEEV